MGFRKNLGRVKALMALAVVGLLVSVGVSMPAAPVDARSIHAPGSSLPDLSFLALGLTAAPLELRKKAKEAQEKAEAIQNGAKAMGRDMSEEEGKTVDGLLDERDKALADAKAAEDTETASRASNEQRGKRLAAGNTLQQSAGRKAGAESTETPKVEVGEPAFKKDPMKGFKNPRDYFGAVLKNGDTHPTASRDERLRYLAAAGTDEHSDNNANSLGFLLPEAMSPDLLSVGVDTNPLAGKTTDLPMQTPTLYIPARTDKDHTTSVSGGLTVSRKAETAAAASSLMKVERVKMEAFSLFGFAFATEELLTDSPASVAAIIAAGFGDEFMSQDFEDLIRGSGIGEPIGILNAECKITVAKEGGQTNTTIVGANILKMRARAWRYGQSFWLANIDTYPQLAQAHVTGDNTDVFLFNPSRGEDSPDTLLGRPIFFTEYCETLGAEGDLININPTQYLTGTYQPLESAESIHVRFDRHERCFKFWKRNAGAPWWKSALTPRKGANSLSPIVTLAGRP